MYLYEAAVSQLAIEEGDEFDSYKIKRAERILMNNARASKFLPVGHIRDFYLVLKRFDGGAKDMELEPEEGMEIALCPIKRHHIYVIGLYQPGRHPMSLVGSINSDDNVVECSASYGPKMFGSVDIEYSLKELESLMSLRNVDRHIPGKKYVKTEPWIIYMG